ncbi:hypothetical protein ACFWNK_20565 [Streptomyces sp. NPDC058417]|uniref:hypothetical protein n=1 Tax=unclassified Streptomyces TaxID=2593676 RepID=UPI0036505F92
MKRRTLPVAVALAATTTLLLTACGGGGEAGVKDEIAGADRSGAKASAAPSARPGVERPAVALPADLTDTFEKWRTGDAVEDAILGDVAERVDATNYAITEADPDVPALRFYYGGGALADARDWVRTVTEDGYSLTGTNRYYDPKVDVFDAKSAGVVYCEDQGKAYAKERDTGKVLKTEVTDKSYVLYTTRVEKNAQGVWQTTKLSSQRSHASCTP